MFNWPSAEIISNTHSPELTVPKLHQLQAITRYVFDLVFLISSPCELLDSNLPVLKQGTVLMYSAETINEFFMMWVFIMCECFMQMV